MGCYSQSLITIVLIYFCSFHFFLQHLSTKLLFAKPDDPKAFSERSHNYQNLSLCDTLMYTSPVCIVAV